MKPGKIRPLAICLFYHEGRILAALGYDDIKKQTFYRPLGGKIEFGEHGTETIVRELQEEIQQAVRDIRYLTTLENIFTFNGQKGHEIVLVYDGAFVDETIYARDAIEGREEFEGDLLFTAHWLTLDFLQAEGAPPIYPHGLLEFLLQHYPQ